MQMGNLFFSRKFSNFSLDYYNLKTSLGYAHICVFSHQSQLGFNEPYPQVFLQLVDIFLLSLQCILIIHWFRICKFSYLLQFIFNSRINTCGVFFVCGHSPTCRMAKIKIKNKKKFKSPDAHVCVLAHTIHRALFTQTKCHTFSFFVLFVSDYTV